MQTTSAPPLSIIHGPPLAEEDGLGALTLPGYLRELTRLYGEREALVFYDADGRVERWSYGELWARAEAVARALVAAGVGKDERVGVLMTNRPEWVSSFFGIGLAGGVAVALSTFSTPAELDYLLQKSCVSALLFERTVLKKDFAAILSELEPQIARVGPGALTSTKFPYLRRLAVVDGDAHGAIEAWDAFLASGASVDAAIIEARAGATRPADPGALFFSSGSTGSPKGILNAHRGVAIQCWRWRRILGFGDDVRSWSANGFFWSANFAGALGATLSAGGSVTLQQTFDPADALQLIEREHLTRAFAWPHQHEQMAAAPNWNDADLSSLRYIDARTKLGQHPSVTTSWVETHECYGATETFTLTAGFPSGTPQELMDGSHGAALPGNTIKIVDPISGETLARGARGEIAVKGPTLMIGYIGMAPEDTFDAEGFFHTGDGGYIDEQDRLVWEGRLNSIIKTGGANVSPVEVDAVLATYSGVKIAQTVGVPHDSLGEIVVACVVAHEGAELDEASIRDFLKQSLASYKVPRRVLFMREDELALTGSAKVKLSDLRDLAQKKLEAETSVRESAQ